MIIPKIKLNNGVEIPCIGNGPGIVGYSPKESKQSNNIIARAYRKFITRPKMEKDYVDAVAHSFQIGFTLFDYSSSYGDGRLLVDGGNSDETLLDCTKPLNIEIIGLNYLNT